MESTSRVSALLGNTRDLTLEAARDALIQRRPSSPQVSISQLKRLLDSRHEREVLDGMRQLVARSQRHDRADVAQFLPIALKSISSPNSNIRKLVYIYLLENAESDPDTALLSINSIQKALSAPDARLRALALRTISSLKVPVIAQIVSLGIRKGAADMSPIVRRTAALAIPKCWKLDANTIPQLEKYLAQLLGDRQYHVVSAAIIAYTECCPDAIELIHPIYRSLVKMLVDIDEWGQLAALRALTSYARRCFPREQRRPKSKNQLSGDEARDDIQDDLDPDLELLLRSLQPLLHSHSSAVVIAVTRLYLALDRRPPGHSPSIYIQSTIGALVALLRTSNEIVPFALKNIIQVMLLYPQPFLRYVRHFLLSSKDGPRVSLLKLEALGLMFPHASRHAQLLILAELKHAAHSSDASVVRASIATLGRCASTSATSSNTSKRCLQLLLAHTGKSIGSMNVGETDTRGEGLVAAEALTQIRYLIQADPEAHSSTIINLAKDLDTTTNPVARASIVWLVGEYATTDGGACDETRSSSSSSSSRGSIGADVLRLLAKDFKSEEEVVKKQILLLSTKVYLTWLNNESHSPDRGQSDRGAISSGPGLDLNDSSPVGDNEAVKTHPIPLLYSHIHTLIRYDTSYTLRDTARVHRALLPPLSSTSHIPAPTATDVNTKLATMLFQCPKPVPKNIFSVKPLPVSRLGSASLAVCGDDLLPGFEQLPEWVEEGLEPDPRLRDQHGVAGPVTMPANASARPHAVSDTAVGAEKDVAVKASGGKRLDDWLESSENESEENESSEEEDESEETEGEDEESESESEIEDERGKLIRA